ncbi:hypothetical protein KO494_09430 [Lacinutrix sp. C3R15]|uniref:DUF6134 family protein n=1 Tax=Flavobacteriaceae TaxID=49546 RepID=UPI001C080CE1|nr:MULTISPECIES: DUF6134 family protein [Flavobacteriaceae]MBU2939758.1 hypothetical protein [Lacinutrix sp. C3R15]MDO6623073.1 hypothetical protein [Oceanihabitans sp. 1_MG-2023]
MIWYLILFQILSFQEFEANTNTSHLKFDIVLKDKIIGQLETTKRIKDSKIHYHSATNITTRIITEINVNYNYNVVFNNNNLKKADVHITVNNKPHAETNTEWLQNQYIITQNNKKEKSIKDPIHYSTILMYFQEPENISYCFSEEDGSINTIVPLGNHTYKKINAKGKENIYYYKNGKLIKAEIDGGLVSFQIITQ